MINIKINITNYYFRLTAFFCVNVNQPSAPPSPSIWERNFWGLVKWIFYGRNILHTS